MKLFDQDIPKQITYQLGVGTGEKLTMVLTQLDDDHVTITDTSIATKGIQNPSEAEVVELLKTAQKKSTSAPLSQAAELVASFKGDLICQGFMHVEITADVSKGWGTDPNQNHKPVEHRGSHTISFVSTANNLLRDGKGNLKLHGPGKHTGWNQVHVEQICMFRIKALIDALTTAKCKDVKVTTGYVRFVGKGLDVMCNQCQEVAVKLKSYGMTDPKMEFLNK